MVLVLVVLFLCVSMVLVVQSVQGRRHMELQMRDVEIRLRHGLLEVLQEAQQVLASDTNLFADTESEAWAQPQDGQWENGVHFHFRLHDAQARFDLNNLSLPEETVRGLQPADLLAELLVHCGYFREEDTIAALVDWLDADEEGVREAGWYHDQGDVRSPVNRPFYSLAELGAFSSRTREWMDSKPRTQNRIREFEGNFPELVTVLPRERRKPVPMNINSVAPELLLALFGAQNRAWADTVLQVRANGPIEDL